METIIWLILSIIFGTMFYTAFCYAWKKLKEPMVAFDMSYFYSMMIAMLLVVLSVPFFLSGRNIPNNLSAFVVLCSGALGFSANALFNIPLTYILKELAIARTAAADALNKVETTAAAVTKGLGTASRRVLELLAIVGLIACVATASTYAVLSYNVTITATGSITGVGMAFYADDKATVQINSVNWGNIPPGGSVTVNVWVKSTSNVPITLLMQSTNYTPIEMAEQLTFSWNYAQQTIQPGAILKLEFTLTASTIAPAGTNFAFNIIVTAMG